MDEKLATWFYLWECEDGTIKYGVCSRMTAEGKVSLAQKQGVVRYQNENGEIREEITNGILAGPLAISWERTS